MHRAQAMEPTITQLTGHSISLAAIFGTLFGWFPPVAAAAAFIWYSIQIYESKTFQHWHRNRMMMRRARKLAKLRAREKMVIAEIEAIEKVRSARVEAREIVATAQAEGAKAVVHDAAVAASKLPPI
jgi:hypothetical protein